MAKRANYIHQYTTKKKRQGTHSKNASKGQSGYKKKYRGQGKNN